MRTKKAQSNFRYGATLDAAVDPALLAKSAEIVLSAYPNFRTKIVKGFFWHKFRANDAPVVAKEDDRPPLSPFRNEETNGYPFRLSYKGNEIVLEIFHAVTDGNVGALFLADLLTVYAALSDGTPALPPKRELTIEDAFRRNVRAHDRHKISLSDYNGESVVALGKKGKYAPHPTLLTEHVDIDAIKRKAAATDSTVTEYIAAAYICAILAEEAAPLKKSLALFIPIDLRRFFPSNTLQNFVCFERIIIEKGSTDFSFDAILPHVKKQFREKITPERMQDHIDDVVKGLGSPILTAVPLFIKAFFFKVVKKLLNKVRQTAILSNVGVFRLPEVAALHVKDVRFYLNIGPNAPVNVAMLSYNGKCNVTVTFGLKESAIPARFFALLRD